jgi:hypothetical protein
VFVAVPNRYCVLDRAWDCGKIGARLFENKSSPWQKSNNLARKCSKASVDDAAIRARKTLIVQAETQFGAGNQTEP